MISLTTSATAWRGTVMSLHSLLGAICATAPVIPLRPRHSKSLCAPSRAHSNLMTSCSRQIVCMSVNSWCAVASRPSTSMMSTAPASSGYPASSDLCTASISGRSISSRAAGMIPAAMMSEAAWPACSTVSNTASIVVTDSGWGMILSTISVMMPSVPSLPTISAAKSSPCQRAALPPISSSSPSTSATCSPSTWLAVTPYLRQCGPPAFIATFPASVETV